MKGFTPQFDRALLDASISARKEAFARVRIRHPMLDEVVSAVLQFLQSDSDRNVIAILGPSGVGKTELLKALERRILREFAARTHSEPSFIPCARIELAAATGACYNFDDLLYRAVAALKDPFVGEWPSDVLAARAAEDAGNTDFWAALRVSTHLRFSFEGAVRYRSPVALLIDEINHVMKISRDRTPLDQCNTMKSLANLTATQFITAGTEAAIDLFEGDGQIGRRAPVVPFHAYPANPEGRQIFFKIACNFLARMPVASIDDDVFDEPYLFAGGVGSVGTLRGWLCDSFAVCLADTPVRFQRKHLEARRHKTQVLHKLIDNIELARERLKDGDLKEVMGRLRLTEDVMSHPQVDEVRPGNGPGDSTPPQSQRLKKGGKRRVGHRKASKDAIGVPENALEVAA